MKRAAHVMLGVLGALLACAGCVDTTGNRLVGIRAQASAAPDVGAVAGQPLRFSTPRGFDVTLTTARVYIGALYFSTVAPTTASGAQEAPCVAPGITTGEVRGGQVFDALDPTPQPFPVDGVGSDLPTRSAALWLTAGDVNADDERTVVLQVAGEASRGGFSWPFEGALRIGSNRVTPPRNPALPSSNPICEQRIVSPVAFEATFSEGAVVWLQVDARAFFSAVNFATLEQGSMDPVRYRFRDETATAEQADTSLFNALRATAGPYRFELLPSGT
ncbi:MAG: hypothetical protein INH41_27785 [Myxococcaceae bacterium]|jgi:hypothetical protein|nr:hypothetical protein [Myxococcaceae bacterium]MCA3016203.1 hypothetical protein [Myxococcaceae bacterium]